MTRADAEQLAERLNAQAPPGVRYQVDETPAGATAGASEAARRRGPFYVRRVARR